MFGTPEFAAPEVINFEDVEFVTDMYVNHFFFWFLQNNVVFPTIGGQSAS